MHLSLGVRVREYAELAGWIIAMAIAVAGAWYLTFKLLTLAFQFGRMTYVSGNSILLLSSLYHLTKEIWEPETSKRVIKKGRKRIIREIVVNKSLSFFQLLFFLAVLGVALASGTHFMAFLFTIMREH